MVRSVKHGARLATQIDIVRSVKHGVKLTTHVDMVWLVKQVALLVAVFVS
jgi:hypothetical protein